MINRENRDWPDDGDHVRDLEAAGAVVIRGEAHLDGPGRVVVRSAAGEQTLTARSTLIAVGTNASVPDDIEGLDQIQPWTNREATSTRELPKSLAVLGAGPTGVEMSQVYARYGVPTVLVSPHDRINPSDHPRWPRRGASSDPRERPKGGLSSGELARNWQEVCGRPSDPPPPSLSRGSDVSRDRRLAECFEVLHRVTEVSLDRSTEQLLCDAGEYTHR